jgi:hypothetical protein
VQQSRDLFVPARDVHVIRHKLQLILALADGHNAPTIEQAVRDINLLLPPSVRFINSVTSA